ncbi:MAG: ABC transporter permease [Synergistaceae bacterium]|jgi:simple sugar transport system permease protein|nr:ABC transporter permease [Synergistaceae bacterium]
MEQFLTVSFITGLLAAAVRMATPIALATTGEILSERSGVLNLGIEGTMLMGAMTGFVVTRLSGSLWTGVAAAAAVGLLLGLLMSVLTVYLGLSQHVSGLGVTLFSTGLSMFIYRLVVGAPVVPPTVEPFKQVAIPILSRIPILGTAFFNQYALSYFAFISAILLWALLYKTNWGLAIRTVGENPFAADTVGIKVNAVRTVCLAVGGALMGVGGAFLTLAHQNMFLIDVVGGRGWVSIAMVIFGNWDPLWAAAGAFLFGLIDALQFRIQTIGFKIPFHLFLALPYLVTIAALVGASRRAGAPAGLLKPYRREEKGG